MASLSGMERLRILSLSRNLLKKIERLEDVAPTLEELWLSYNQISSLDGLAPLQALEVLYLGNNRVSDWAELDKLAALPKLRDLLLTGNPLYDAHADKAACRAAVVKRVPQIQKLDNEMITSIEREAAAKL
jgi:dynein light chain 1